MFKYYSHLGFHSKFYINDQEKVKLFDDFFKATQAIKCKEIDPVAISEFINRFYFFGDRTLLNDLYKTPWLSKLVNNNWEPAKLCAIDNGIETESEFYVTLLMELEREIINYVGEHTKVGILLSGGMDSRVVAGILRKLINEGKLDIEVTAITWGVEESRDVVYSRRISELYGWNFKHLPITAETLKDNVEIAALEGAEYSAVNLHAMKDVSLLKDIDLILAGSFGDSIGRGEYSGTHVSNLTSISRHISNKFCLLNKNIFKQCKDSMVNDIQKYYQLFPRQMNTSLYELERQIHYMRRELNTCMSVISKRIPVRQVFTSPDVYNLVLNTDKKLRTDNIYSLILEKISPELLDIPWARTGLHYMTKSGNPDSYSKEYHFYGKWIKNDLHEFIKSKVLNGNIKNLNLFNVDSIEILIRYNKKFGGDKLNKIDELLIWLASLSSLINMIELKSVEIKSETYFQKKLSKLHCKAYTFCYLMAIRFLK